LILQSLDTRQGRYFRADARLGCTARGGTLCSATLGVET